MTAARVGDSDERLARPRQEESETSTPKGPEDIGQLAAEVGRRFGLYHEQVDRLQTEQAQENERLRADLGRLEAEIARINHDNDRLRAEQTSCWPPFAKWPM